ncbi:MAG: N-acetyltransferase [Anaerolineae bacterium]|nr:N-acetyltransferase [Anaerolineae bacterium]
MPPMAALIRFATADDAAPVLDIYRPVVEGTPTSFETEVPTLAEMQARIATTQPWLVCEIGGVVAGYAYAGPFRKRAAYQWSVEVSAYVHADYRRRGVGTALYTALFTLLRAHGIVNAYAGISLPNPASVRLHESVGFTPVGVYRGVGYKFGQWHDVGWWELALVEQPADPQPPVPVLPPEVVAAAFAAGLARLDTDEGTPAV